MDFSSQGPEDQELRNLIDKLAQFVARNGADFERMTKEKQKGNPRFSFLFGGDYYNYYQYRLTTEQAILRKQSQQVGGMGNGPPPFPPASFPPNMPPNVPPPNFIPPWVNRPPPPPISMNIPPPTSMCPPSNTMGPPPHVQLQQLQMQLDDLQEQINSSDRNLVAQRDSLMTQQQNEIEQLRLDLPRRTLQNLVNATGISLDGFEHVVQPVIDACTKDNIAAAKSWIFSTLSSPQHFDLFSLFLFHRAITLSTSGSPNFEHCLHLVYLVNDLLHHAVRKSNEALRCSLRRVIPALFSEAMIISGGEEDKLAKLTKLTTLWRQNSYLDEQILSMLEDTNNRYGGRNWFLQEIMHTMMPSGDSHFAATCNDIEKRYNLQYYQLEQQNNEYAAHIKGQMQQIKQMMQNVAVQTQAPPSMPRFTQSPPMMSGPPPPNPQWSSAPPPPLLSSNQNMPFGNNVPPPLLPPPSDHQPKPQQPPHQQQPPLMLLDTSRPPPSLLGPPQPANFQNPPKTPSPLPPPAPYYDLPAGLMIPLIKPEDNNYQPLNPNSVLLPPPCPPSERLLAAVEAFYAPPSHDNPRDSEGWERLGLYEFYQAKERALRENKKRLSDEPEEVVKVKLEKPPRRRQPSESSHSSSKSPLPYLRTSRSRSRSVSSNESYGKDRTGGHRRRSVSPP